MLLFLKSWVVMYYVPLALLRAETDGDGASECIAIALAFGFRVVAFRLDSPIHGGSVRVLVFFSEDEEAAIKQVDEIGSAHEAGKDLSSG
jgi:hypothetical protein